MMALGLGLGLPFSNGGGGTTAVALQNVAVNMGDHTNKNSGGVYLKNLGLKAAGSGPIATWQVNSIVAHGGGANSDLLSLSASVPVVNATARTPLPQLGDNSNLTVTLAATSYTMTVTAVGVDGSTATCTLTFNIVANAWNRGDDAARDGVDAWNVFKTQVGGLTLLLSTGADYMSSPWNGGFEIKYFAPASGRVTVQYADAARPSQIGIVQLTNIVKTDLRGLGIGGTIGTKILFTDTSDDVHCYDFYPLGASIADVNFAGNAGADLFINITGATTNCTAERCELWWGGRGLVMSGVGNKIKDCTIRYHFGDGSALGICTNCEFTGNTLISPMRQTDLSGSPDHLDSIQFGESQTLTGVLAAGNAWIQADGNGGTGGLQGGQADFNTATYASNITLGRTGTSGNWGAWTGSTAQDCTIFQTGSGLINNSAVLADDNIVNVVPHLISTLGSGNVLSRVYTSGSIGMSAGWTTTNCLAESVSYPNVEQYPFSTTIGVPNSGSNYTPNFHGDTHDFSNVFNFADARERLDNYNASTNPNGTDYPNMTCAQILARVLLILTPKTGGSLDLGGGVTIGAIKLDGTLKPVPTASAILLESGSYLLLESGSKLLKE